MAIILAYKIEPESPQTPKPSSPTSSRNYTNVHRHTATTPHAPPNPARVAPAPVAEQTIESKKPVVIPQPAGRKVITPPPDPEAVMDAKTIWNTQFNSRRAAPRPHNTTPISTASSIRSAVSAPWSQKSHARRRKRVSFTKQLVTVIPPSCRDLILYGTHHNLPAPMRPYWAWYWRPRAGRFVHGGFVHGGLWITGFIVVELILLAFMVGGRKRSGVGGAAEWGHDDNF